jgi:ABC-2 type transport system ATP-binding protein
LSWIEISNLSKNYGKREVIHDLNLRVEEGISLIQGHNGAGKSTLISIMEGLTRFKSGKVSVLGIDPRKEPKKLMEMVSFIPESPVFFGSQNIQEFLNIYTKLNGGNREYLKYYMDTFGISEIASSHFQSLSKGEAQLVQIVASFSTQKGYFVMDEPNSNLDVKRRRDLSKEIKKLKDSSGSSFLIVTHIIDDIFPISDHIYLMNSGKIQLSSDLKDLNSDGLVEKITISALDLPGIMKSLDQLNPIQSGHEIIISGVDMYRIISSLSADQIKSITSIKKSLEMPS